MIVFKFSRANLRIVASLLLLLIGQLAAAPLFDDPWTSSWAADSVAALAAKGLIQGFPDGTFKGDRSATRWELASLVARLLSRIEGGQAGFATGSSVEEVTRLALALRPELEALGARVDHLEQKLSGLDSRVTGLERITFYGSLDTRVLGQSFYNQGSRDNDDDRAGNGVPGSVPYLNYGNAVGSSLAPPWRPMLVGVLPVVDYRNGRPLTSGTGFTSLARLGINLKVSAEIDSGAEFAAFSSQGDQIVDAYWGVSAPYQQNIFSANASSDQSLANTPYTRMTLDHFWLVHKPSKTKLVVGVIDHTSMDPLIYAGQGNLGVFGPARWPGYGFDLSGEAPLAPDQQLKWELMGTKFGDGVRLNGTNYQNYVLNGNLNYQHKNAALGFSFSRMAEEAPSGGQPLATGLNNGLNVRYGDSSGWSVRQWVNPPGWFALQRSPSEIAQTASVGNTADTRPIPGWNAAGDNTVGYGPGAGNYGPEAQTLWGLNGRYDLALAKEGNDKLSLQGHFGHSDWRPNRNSAYTASGLAWVTDLDAYLLNGDLDLGATYLSIDPNYSPSSWFGNVLGGRPVKPFNFTGVFHLYDSGKYPQNREGVRLRGKWQFHHRQGKIWTKADFLKQRRTSLYDVRVTNGALGSSIPTNDVLGFSPGFVDTAFFGLAHPSLYGPGSANSFDSTLSPLENPRGHERYYELGLSYRWADTGWGVAGSASRNRLFRPSSLGPALGGSQNQVDVTVDSYNLEVSYEITKEAALNGGVDLIDARGHYDPGGLYNSYAVSTASNSFQNIHSQQLIPHLSLDYSLDERTTWNITGRHYHTTDLVDPSIQPGSRAFGQIGSTAHPFAWSGWQVSSEFKLAF